MLPAQSRGPASQALALEMFRRRYAAHSEDATAPYPGIPEVLARLERLGVATAIVSNKDDALVKSIAQRYFPDHTFTAVIGRRDGVPAKPDPASVDEAMRAIGVPRAAALYVGDSDVDVQTAHNAHLACCGAVWGFRGEEELRRAGADFLAADAAALLRAVLQMP